MITVILKRRIGSYPGDCRVTLGGRVSLNWIEESTVISCKGIPIAAEILPVLVVLDVEVSVSYIYYGRSTWNIGEPLSQMSGEHVIIARECVMQCLSPFGPHGCSWGRLSWPIEMIVCWVWVIPLFDGR